MPAPRCRTRENSDDSTRPVRPGQCPGSLRLLPSCGTDSVFHGRSRETVEAAVSCKRSSVHVCGIVGRRQCCSWTMDGFGNVGNSLSRPQFRKRLDCHTVIEKFCTACNNCGSSCRRHIQAFRLFSMRGQRSCHCRCSGHRSRSEFRWRCAGNQRHCSGSGLHRHSKSSYWRIRTSDPSDDTCPADDFEISREADGRENTA